MQSILLSREDAAQLAKQLYSNYLLRAYLIIRPTNQQCYIRLLATISLSSSTQV